MRPRHLVQPEFLGEGSSQFCSPFGFSGASISEHNILTNVQSSYRGPLPLSAENRRPWRSGPKGVNGSARLAQVQSRIAASGTSDFLPSHNLLLAMFRILRSRCYPRSGATAVRLYHRSKATARPGSLSLPRRNFVHIGGPRSQAITSSCRSFVTATSQENDPDEPELLLEDEGEYEIILPQDPAPWDFSASRPVPAHIPRPPYASSQSLEQYQKTGKHAREIYVGDGRVQLGGEEEKNLREAAQLARRVLRMAGTLAQVDGSHFVLGSR